MTKTPKCYCTPCILRRGDTVELLVWKYLHPTYEINPTSKIPVKKL